MKRALIQPAKCRNCPDCLVELNCSMKAIIREDRAAKPWVDFYRCSGCLKCKTSCRNGSIEEVTQPCGGRMAW